MNFHWKDWLVPNKGNDYRPVLLRSQGFIALSILIVFFNLILLGSLKLPQLNGVFGYQSVIEPSEVVQAVNQKRQTAKLPALEQNPHLTQAAKTKALDMFEKQYWSHNNPDGNRPWHFIDQTGYEYLEAGENLAKNFVTTEAMIKAWMMSPTHQANILNADFDQTGVAVVEGKLEGVETTLVVQLFAKSSRTIGSLDNKKNNNSLFNLTNIANQNSAKNNNLLGSSTTNRNPINPLNLYRWGLVGLLSFLIVILAHDLWIERNKSLSRKIGKNIAHIVLIVAVIATLVLAESGVL